LFPGVPVAERNWRAADVADVVGPSDFFTGDRFLERIDVDEIPRHTAVSKDAFCLVRIVRDVMVESLTDDDAP
jgi:hypothetical protein